MVSAAKRKDQFIDQMRECAICPAVVFLIGPASSGSAGSYTCAWPLFLPLAPYLEYMVRQGDGAQCDA